MGKNGKAAEAVLNRKKLAIRAGKYADPADTPRITFEAACDDYLHRKSDLKLIFYNPSDFPAVSG